MQTEGPRGLMRGADAAALRVGVGSSVQLPLYDNAKSLILATGVPSSPARAHAETLLILLDLILWLRSGWATISMLTWRPVWCRVWAWWLP